MFDFRSRKKKLDGAAFIRRIIDITTPSQLVNDELRQDRRFNRTLPLVICLCEEDRPVLTELVMGISNDFSNYGIGLIALEAIDYPECFVSVWPQRFGIEEPIHFRCEMRTCRKFCHGFWALGFAINEVLTRTKSVHVCELDQVVRAALGSFQEAPDEEVVVEAKS